MYSMDAKILYLVDSLSMTRIEKKMRNPLEDLLSTGTQLLIIFSYIHTRVRLSIIYHYKLQITNEKKKNLSQL